MRRHAVPVIAAALAVAACAPSSGGGSPPPSGTPRHAVESASASGVPHVLVIVEENREYSGVIGSSAAPYVNRLASKYGLATRSYGRAHPSLPNYLDLLSGSTWGVTDDGTGYLFPGPTFVDQLAGAGIGWRAYMEGMPSACYGGGSSGGYAKKHDPFMYFSSITQNAAQCANVVPYSQASSDLASGSAPPFLWVTPNLCDDGHDCSTQTMDSWLSANLPMFLSSSWFQQDGEVILTWDEGSTDAGCCGSAWGGHVATIVIAGHGGRAVTSGAAVDHAGTLATLETLYGLPPLREAACGCSGNLRGLAIA